jgi:glutamate racemase
MGGASTSSSDLTVPVGAFDSGVGGLSVLRSIRAALPGENLVYVADSGHVPYGNKSPEYIQARSLLITRFLADQGVKGVVVACNTATAAAAECLRREFQIPVVAMEPAVKPAAAATRSGVVGVMATVGTLASARFAALLERFGRDVKVVVQACPGLVEQIESGDLGSEATRRLVEKFTAPLRKAGADVIVLGSTHYPFLRPMIASVVGPDVTLIDTGAAVAHQLERVLTERGLLNPSSAEGKETFWTSGDSQAALAVFSRLWGSDVQVQRLPPEFA